MNKQKILFITRNLPPLVGGMEALNFRIFSILKEIYSLDVIGPAGAEDYLKQKMLFSAAVKPLWLYLVKTFVLTFLKCIRRRYWVVFCGSGLVAPMGWVASRLTGANFVIYLHGLDLVAKNVVYRCIFIPLIKRADVIIVNSNYTKSVALHMGVSTNRLHVLHPGVDEIDLSKKELLKSAFRDKYNLKEKKVLLIAGRITGRKGIKEFIENAFPSIVAKEPSTHLVIVGEEAKDAIKHSKGVTEAIYRSIQQHSLNEKITLCGALNDAELNEAYFAADLLIFPVLNLPDDVEGFGMVAVEAAARGIPTIAFAVGGIPDSVAESTSGRLIADGDYSGFANKVLSELADQTISVASCIEHAEKFYWKQFGKNLVEKIGSIEINGKLK